MIQVSNINGEVKTTISSKRKTWAHDSFKGKDTPFLNGVKPVNTKILKNLKNDTSIIITKPDKGNGVVILNKTDYIEKNWKYFEW